MAFDGITTAALTRELNEALAGGGISKIIQPEKDELLLTVKSNKVQYRVALSASASLPLVYLTPVNKQAPMTAPNFCMLLRKHLQGGQILRVHQPSLERVIIFDVSHRDELGDLVVRHLIIELMGKYSNIILTDDDDTILDSIKRVPFSVSSVREVLPGKKWFIPGADTKLNPLTTDPVTFGETILIISGLLDLSSGAVMAFAGTLSVMCYKAIGEGAFSMIVAILVAIAIAMFCNALNALMVTTFKAPAFIVTLAMQTMARGAALLLTAGQNVYQIGGYTVLGQGSLWIVPIPILFMIFFFLVTRYILSDTRFGRSLYAIGGNEAAANASGIAVNKVKTVAYLVNGVMVGMAAVLFMSRVNAGLPNGAIGYETEALTTAIIGGTSFTGGIGTAGGTIVGAFIVGFLNNIMNLTSVNSYVQQIIKGAIIALAVIYDIYAKSRRTRKKMGNIEDKAEKK